MRTIAISSYKGGVGKTTTAVNLTAIFAARDRRPLLVDLNPQASAIDFVDQFEMLLREQRLKFALDDASGSYDVCLIDCSPA